MNPIVEIKSLSKRYFNELVLDGVTLEVMPQRFYALLGHNGAGKSTLLKILAGQEFADEVEGVILGEKFHHDFGELKNHIGFVSEGINFEVNTSLEKFFKYYRRSFSDWDQEFFEDLMYKRGFDLTREFIQFSRGQKMQIVLIATLATRPKIMMVDEVTSVLDVYARKYYINLLLDYVKKGGTVIMTTNIITEVQNIANAAIMIDHKKILFNKTIEELKNDILKLRRTRDNHTNPIFDSPYCYWIGTNSDLSDSYVIDKNYIEQFAIPSDLYDRRAITLEEIYMYYASRSDFGGGG